MRIESNSPNLSAMVNGVFFGKVADGSPDDWKAAKDAHKAAEPVDKKSSAYVDWEWHGRDLDKLLKDPPPWMLSEDIDEERARPFLRLSSFRVAARTDSEKEAVDRAIANVKRGADPIGQTSQEREIAELQNANMRQYRDYMRERDRADDLEKKLAAAVTPIPQRIKDLELANEKVAGELAEAMKQNTTLAAELERLTKKPAEAPSAGPIRAPRKRRRNRRAKHAVATPAEPVAAAPAS